MRTPSRACRARGLALAALLSALAACGTEDAQSAAVVDSAATAPRDSVTEAAAPETPAAPAAPTGPAAELPPNELGRIMVLEYHRLGDNEGEFVRKAENFRKDLQALYERGYRPVTMRQVLDGDLDLPAGTTPVVFTIDDSSLGQFYYLPDGRLDPNTMVGMWAAFQTANPAWKSGAVWCVLPAAQHPSNFFSEKPDREFASREEREANIRKKVTYLVENGHELCNHTLYHARLDKGTDAQVQEWLGRGEDSIQVYLPEGYDIVTMALPLGMWPKNRALAWEGSWKGRPYEYRAVLEVSGGPNVSPFDRGFNPRSVNRFIVAPGALERQLERWEKDPSNRYVSDGDASTITVPQRLAASVDRGRWTQKQVKVLPDAEPAVAGQGASPATAAAP